MEEDDPIEALRRYYGLRGLTLEERSSEMERYSIAVLRLLPKIYPTARLASNVVPFRRPAP